MQTNGTYIFRGMVLPEDTREGLDNFIQFGIPTGGFLEACIDNDLADACGRADEHNLPILPAIVAYLYNEAPFGCWGFSGAHNRWVERKLAERKKKAAEENGDGRAETGLRVERDVADER